jgi:hypothetical protein
MGEHAAAATLMQEALAGRRVLGDVHPYTRDAIAAMDRIEKINWQRRPRRRQWLTRKRRRGVRRRGRRRRRRRRCTSGWPSVTAAPEWIQK